MKKLLVAMVAVLVAAASYGQGQVSFNNFFDPPGTPAGTSGIYRPGTPRVGAGAGYTAALYLASNLASPLATTTFFTDPGAEFYLNPVDVTLSGILGGTSQSFVIRAWETAGGSFANASIKGETGPFSNKVGGDPGGGGAATPPENTIFTGFVMVPEPSTIALGVLGAAALLFRRRK
jgi:hypothetical protein